MLCHRLVTVFHGTSIKNLSSIRKSGILGTPKNPSPWNFPVGWVFVTTDFEKAKKYACLSYGPNGIGKRLKVAILEIKMHQEDLSPDPVDGYLGISSSLILKRNVHPSEISKVHIMEINFK